MTASPSPRPSEGPLVQKATQRAQEARERALSQGLARHPPAPLGLAYAPLRDCHDRFDWQPGEATMVELWRAVRLSQV